MPLVIRHHRGLDCPTVVCDHCGKNITTAADGNYQWRWDDGPCEVFFTHKACCPAFEHSRGGLWGAMELELLPLYLANNLKVDRKKAEQAARFFASL